MRLLASQAEIEDALSETRAAQAEWAGVAFYEPAAGRLQDAGPAKKLPSPSHDLKRSRDDNYYRRSRDQYR